MSAASQQRKQRKFAVGQGKRPNSEINITPLVDVVLVLLIIFMVVTPLLEKDIDVRVPDVDEQQDQDDEPPPDQIVVNIKPDGTLQLNSSDLPDADYVEKLRRVLAAKKDDKLVFFMADDKANYGKVIFALDGARKAGAQILGMMTEQLPQGAVPGGQPAPPTPPAP